MPTHITVLLVIIFTAISAGMWFGVSKLVMAVAGMTKQPDISGLGKLVENYGIGSIRIKGININNCLYVYRYERGYLIQLWKIFGGGKRVILDSDIRSVSERPKVLMFRSSLVVLKDGSSIRFSGQVAKRIAENVAGIDHEDSAKL